MLVAAAGRGCVLRVAVAAVNGAISPRRERDFCVLATLGANSGVHLTGGPASVTTATLAALRLAGRATGSATLRLIGEAATSVVLLIFCGERELGATIDAT